MKKYILAFLLFTALMLSACYENSDSNDYYQSGIDNVSIPNQRNYDEDDIDLGQNIEYLSKEAVSFDIKYVSASPWQTLVITDDGGLWSWGGNVWIDGNPLPQRILDNVIYAVSGQHNSIAITSDGSLWSWGGAEPIPEWEWVNFIGDGTVENRIYPVKIMEDVVYATIAPMLSNSHMGHSIRSFAITHDHVLWGWGQNGESYADMHGFLGDGTTINRHAPVRILDDVVSIIPSYSGGYALTSDGTVWLWGHGSHERDWGDFTEPPIWLYVETTPVPIMDNVKKIIDGYMAITNDNVLWSFENADLRFIREDVLYATSIDGGNFFIDSNNILWGYGENHWIDNWMLSDYGQVFPQQWNWGSPLGNGTIEGSPEPVQIMENVAAIKDTAGAVFVITLDDELWGWGSNTIGQVGNGTTWGPWEWYPNVDHEDREWRAVHGPTLSPELILENVKMVSADFHIDHGWISHINIFVVTNSGELFAWGGGGFNAEYALGDGIEDRRYTPTLINIKID